MKRTKHFAPKLFAFVCFLLISSSSARSFGEQTQDIPSYTPGRFIVKFKTRGPHALEGCAHCLLAGGLPFKEHLSDGSGSVDQLNSKFKVKAAQGLFFEHHNMTASQARQKRDQTLRKVNSRFAARARRAPSGYDFPDTANVYVFDVPKDSDVEEICLLYEQDPHVEFAHPDYIMTAGAAFNDTYWATQGSWGQAFDDLWGVKTVGIETALDPPTLAGDGIVVGVVDSGVDWNHIDIADNIWINADEIPGTGFDNDNNDYIDDVRGWDFVNNDNDPADGHGHGTHVAGIIAAVANNGFGIVGVAPKVKVMPVKGLSDDGGGSIVDLARAMDYASMNGADIVHNSWGCGTSRCPSVPAVELSVRQAYGLGAVVVFSAGNQNDDARYYSPKNMEETIVAAASDPDDTRSSFSNFGHLIDVTAPGRHILSLNAMSGNNRISTVDCPSCVLDTDYLHIGGTSMSAAFVSGVAALVLANTTGLTNEDVRQVLRATSDDIESVDFDMLTGAGRVNAQNALSVSYLLNARIDLPNDLTTKFTQDGQVIVQGTAAGADFAGYQVFYSEAATPSAWQPLGPPSPAEVTGGTLGYWDVAELPPGQYYLYLKAQTHEGWDFEDVVSFALNRPPEFGPLTEQHVLVGQNLQFSVAGTHTDGIGLSLRVVEPLPANAEFNTGEFQVLSGGESRVEGVFSWTPRTGQAGTYEIVFELEDSSGSLVISDPVMIYVAEVDNTDPIVQGILFQDNVISWSARDKEDGEDLTFVHRVDGGPWSAPTASSMLSIEPLDLAPGRHEFEIMAVDRQGARSRPKSKRINL